MITVRTPSGDKGAASLTLRTPSGDAGIARMTLRTPSGDELIFDGTAASALTVTQNPFSAVGSGGSAADIPVTTNEVTVTAAGGTEPYSYAWSKISGAVEWSILSASSRATRFTHSAVAEGVEEEALFRCTVTDARGRTGTVDVQAYAFNFGSFL